jgi:cell division protein FtsN
MKKQSGSTFIGIVLGLTVGIGIAVGLALWLSKAKMPIFNKVQGKEMLNSLDEVNKNKNWDPNSQLFGKAPPPSLASKGASAVSTAIEPQPETQSEVIDKVVGALQNANASNLNEVKSTKVKGSGEVADPKTIGVGVDTKSANPDKVLGRENNPDNSTATTAKSNSKNTTSVASSPIATNNMYSVQVGAFKSKEDASAQKARLALLGIETKITEVDQAGKVIYRVRSASMTQTEAQNLKVKLDKASVENGLVKAP